MAAKVLFPVSKLVYFVCGITRASAPRGAMEE